MKAKRRRHDTAFKARVGLEALKGQKTTQQIAAEYDVAGLPLKDLFEFDVEKRHWLGSFAMQAIPAATQVE
jgi:hypothetical protein